ncbi:MAG: hypothetical protein KF781_05195 [Chitinophagaceae bacterium]|nr:hypothetical protein [Chitinophagaceae bacterium]MCW5905913.1 hypothetical protein [Chitinophagaceae bacterium]
MSILFIFKFFILPQITLNIPSDKVQKFLIALEQSSIINSLKSIITDSKYITMQPIFINNGLQTQHPYFDAEFYANDIFEQIVFK